MKWIAITQKLRVPFSRNATENIVQPPHRNIGATLELFFLIFISEEILTRKGIYIRFSQENEEITACRV